MTRCRSLVERDGLQIHKRKLITGSNPVRVSQILGRKGIACRTGQAGASALNSFTGWDMKKIKELFGKYPVTANSSSYFAATFVGTGAVATAFNRPIEEAIFMSVIMAVTGGVIGWVKTVDKDGESE